MNSGIGSSFSNARLKKIAATADVAKEKMKPMPMLACSFILGAFIMWIVPALLHNFGIAANLAYPALVVAASVWHFYCEHMMSLERSNR